MSDGTILLFFVGWLVVAALVSRMVIVWFDTQREVVPKVALASMTVALTEDDVMGLLETLGTRMSKYYVTRLGGTSIAFTRRVRPWWVLPVVVFIFPVGLFALFAKTTQTGKVSVKRRGSNSELRFKGKFAPATFESIRSEFDGKTVRPQISEASADGILPPAVSEVVSKYRLRSQAAVERLKAAAEAKRRR